MPRDTVEMCIVQLPFDHKSFVSATDRASQIVVTASQSGPEEVTLVIFEGDNVHAFKETHQILIAEDTVVKDFNSCIDCGGAADFLKQAAVSVYSGMARNLARINLHASYAVVDETSGASISKHEKNLNTFILLEEKLLFIIVF